MLDVERVLAQLQKLEDEARRKATLARREGFPTAAAGDDGRADAFATARDVVQGVPF